MELKDFGNHKWAMVVTPSAAGGSDVDLYADKSEDYAECVRQYANLRFSAMPEDLAATVVWNGVEIPWRWFIVTLQAAAVVRELRECGLEKEAVKAELEAIPIDELESNPEMRRSLDENPEVRKAFSRIREDAEEQR